MNLRKLRSEKGTALLETALVLPLLLAVSVGIFEFGRAYQTWQVITNAAREGARVAVLPNSSATAATTRAKAYLTSGQLPDAGSATVAVTPETLDLGGGLTAGASKVTVSYPFQFIALGPVVQLLSTSPTTIGSSVTMTASAVMRNE